MIADFFNHGRTVVAGHGLGLAAAAIESASEFVHDREAFGRTVDEFQAVQHDLAEMRMAFESARALTWRTREKVENDENPGYWAALSKATATEAATECAETAMKLHGGRSVIDENRVARVYRDVRVPVIYEGANPIQRNLIYSQAPRWAVSAAFPSTDAPGGGPPALVRSGRAFRFVVRTRPRSVRRARTASWVPPVASGLACRTPPPRARVSQQHRPTAGERRRTRARTPSRTLRNRALPDRTRPRASAPSPSPRPRTRRRRGRRAVAARARWRVVRDSSAPSRAGGTSSGADRGPTVDQAGTVRQSRRRSARDCHICVDATVEVQFFTNMLARPADDPPRADSSDTTGSTTTEEEHWIPRASGSGPRDSR